MPAVRERWAQQIAPGSVIVFDCLYSVLAALGISENDDTVAAVLLGLRALATECKALGTIMVHHLGKDDERGARGHSSIEGWPDVLCRIRLDGAIGSDTARMFSAYGRGVDVESGVLVLGDDHRLTLESQADKRAAAKSNAHDADDAAVLAAMRAQAGLNNTALVDAAGVPQKRVYAACKRLAERGIVENRGASNRPAWHAAASESAHGDLFASPADLVSGTARTDAR